MNGWERGSTGNRYQDIHSQKFLDFTTYQRIATGRKATKTTYLNTSMPSLATIDRNRPKVFAKMVPGVVYVDDYVKFIEANGYSKKTVIASDATVVERSITFDSTTEQLHGFVPKLITERGLPSYKSFPTDRPSQMIGYFNDRTLQRADNLNLILATPMDPHAKSFPLCIFPTNNSYTSEHSYNRNSYIADCLESEDIEVLFTCTDADPKEKGGAKILVHLVCLDSKPI